MVESDNEEDYVVPAVNGVLNAIEAARSVGVKNFVSISSVAAIFGNQRESNPDHVFTEEDWNNAPGSPYAKSKTEAERILWEYYEAHKDVINVTAINPGFVLGPILSPHALSTTKKLLDIVNGVYNEEGVFPPEKYVYIDVRDVSDIAIKALTDERAIGQRYLVANPNQIGLAHIAQVANNNDPELPIITAEEPEDITYNENTTNPKKATQFLGRPFISLDKSILDTLESFKKYQLINN
eukprot:TRINITY_DN1995_c0_g1_i1.p1 TRINITY_DN1995_c0_g1~~TRINITY_DN1995_c0_g1_i1.p1  ORF type:complete len:239 (-),score=61.67 TRINITY_DN1995_c0_g1_i1:21-737(-)